MDNGSPLVTAETIRVALRQAVIAAGGVRAFAEQRGLASHARVSLALNGGDITEAVANSVGFVKRTIFERVTHGSTRGSAVLYGVSFPVIPPRGFKSAAAEARRLARQNPGQEFFVLAPVRSVMCNDICERDFVFDDIPF